MDEAEIIEELEKIAKHALHEAAIHRGCYYEKMQENCQPDDPPEERCGETCGISGGLRRFGLWPTEPRPGWPETQRAMQKKDAEIERLKKRLCVGAQACEHVSRAEADA